MATIDKSSGRRGVYYTAAAACLFLIAGLLVLTLGLQESTDAERPAAEADPPASAPPVSGTPRLGAAPRDSQARRARTKLQPRFADSPPVAMTIPRIGVRASTFERLGLARNGEIQVPQDAANPGWYTPGPAPGQVGPAVIAGHLDDEFGPAVFYRLSELRPGDRVKITPRRGPVQVFAVDRVANFDKNAFPTKAVYGPTVRAEIRLITCEGRYDDEDGYVRNTVVFAHLL